MPAAWQVLLTGKISQAAVLSAAAYEDEATFRRITGIEKCRLIVDKKDRNTHVCGLLPLPARSPSSHIIHRESMHHMLDSGTAMPA